MNACLEHPKAGWTGHVTRLLLCWSLLLPAQRGNLLLHQITSHESADSNRELDADNFRHFAKSSCSNVDIHSENHLMKA